MGDDRPAYWHRGWSPWGWECLGFGFPDGGRLAVYAMREAPRWWENRRALDRAERKGLQPITVTLNGQVTRDWSPTDIYTDPIRVRRVGPGVLQGVEQDPCTPEGAYGAWVDTPGGWTTFVPEWCHLESWHLSAVPRPVISLTEAVAGWRGAPNWAIGEPVPTPLDTAVWCDPAGLPYRDRPDPAWTMVEGTQLVG